MFEITEPDNLLWQWTGEAVTVSIEVPQELNFGYTGWETRIEVIMINVKSSELR